MENLKEIFLEAPALLIIQLVCKVSARSCLLERVGSPKGFVDLCEFSRSALTKGFIMVMYGEGSVGKSLAKGKGVIVLCVKVYMVGDAISNGDGDNHYV